MLNANEIIKNGGATLNKKGEVVSYVRGYQVSKCDLFIVPVSKVTNKAIKNWLGNINSQEFLGIWVDNGKAYIDKSIRIGNQQKALDFGRKNSQISIFSWCKKTCLYC